MKKGAGKEQENEELRPAPKRNWKERRYARLRRDSRAVSGLLLDVPSERAVQGEDLTRRPAGRKKSHLALRRGAKPGCRSVPLEEAFSLFGASWTVHPARLAASGLFWTVPGRPTVFIMHRASCCISIHFPSALMSW